jgi:hypothetical protein
MPGMYKLVAVPHLLAEGEFKGHLETVTFVAATESESHKWWSVNVGTFERDFSQVVSPELATHFVNRLRRRDNRVPEPLRAGRGSGQIRWVLARLSVMSNHGL